MPRHLRTAETIGSSLSVSTSLVFQADLTSNITPQVGTAGSFTRVGTQYYYDSLTSLGLATSGNAAAPAFPLNGAGTSGGVYIGGARANLILQSEAPATTWTKVVGTETVTNGVGTFLVGGSSITYGTILTAAINSGITQTSATAAASTTFVGSVYASVASGTQPVTLTLAGVGGTPETTTKAITLTTTPQRFYISKTFSAGATGNCLFKITADNSGVTIRVGGMMLQDATNGAPRTKLNFPTAYIKTTTGTASVNRDDLFFSGSEITSLSSRFTVAFWFNSGWLGTQAFSGTGRFLFNFNNSGTLGPVHLLLWNNAGTSRYDLYLNAVESKSVSWNPTEASGVWRHEVFTLDFSSLAFKYFSNGVEQTITSSSTAGATAPTISGFTLSTSLNPEAMPDAIYSRIKIYNYVLSAGEVSTLYNAEKGNYGL